MPYITGNNLNSSFSAATGNYSNAVLPTVNFAAPDVMSDPDGNRDSKNNQSNTSSYMTPLIAVSALVFAGILLK